MTDRPLLLVNHRDLAENVGRPSGVANFLIALTRRLVERGNLRIGLVSSWRREDFPAAVTDRLALYEHRRMHRPRVADVVKQAVTMPRLARRVQADAILNIDPVGAPRGANVRLTVVHDLYFRMLPGQFPFRERLFNDWITRLMIAGSDAVVCVSDRTREDLEQIYPGARGKALRIYPDAVATVAPERPGEGSEVADGHLLWVGNITPNKNLACFYAALGILAARGLRPKAVVVGRDPLGIAAAVERQTPPDLRPLRPGNVSDDALRALYAGAVAFVNTSLYEGFGMPVIEAQRAGIPVVCSTGGAVGEVAGDGALTFTPHDPVTLADHLERVLNDAGLRQALRQRGFANAARFSWDSTAAAIEEQVLVRLRKGAPRS